MAVLRVLLAIASLLCLTAGYELKANYNASNFFNDSSFLFHDGYDTDGLALYVPKTEAILLGLARYQDDRVYLGVDNSSILDSSTADPGNGRKSVRLEGVQTFNKGLIVADFEHLPSGCGQWPGFWLMHDECGVNATALTLIESAAAGVWAMQIEDDGMKAWFFARGLEPSDMANDNPDPSSWGEPLRDFVLSPCDVSKKMKIIINLAFCGPSWPGCAVSTGVNFCGEHVANKPSAFTDAYILINSIKIFQQDTSKVPSDNNTVPTTTGTTLTSIYRDPIPQSTSYVFQYTVVTKTVTKTMTMIGGIIRYTSDGAVYYTSDGIVPYTADGDSSSSATATPTASTTEHADITPMYRNQIPQSTSVVFQTSIFTKTVTETMTMTGGLTRWTDIESWTTSSTSKSTRTAPLWSFPDWTRTRKTTTSSATTSSATTSSATTSFPVWSLPDRPQPQPMPSFLR